MKIPRPVEIDFETEGIEARPSYPPKPVGVALRVPGEKAEYLAWGHPIENNCSRAHAIQRLKKVWNVAAGNVFHNGKFDVDVGETHLGLGPVAPERYHDTLFLAFLSDPHAPSLSLKPLAERRLGLKPVERDAVRDWLVEQRLATKKNWGAHICRAPGRLVGAYAIGDVARTGKLFANLYEEVVIKRSMGAAYDRERDLMPILLKMERVGLRVHHAKLRRDVARYGGEREQKEDGGWTYRGGVIGELDAAIRKKLRAPGLDLDKKDDLADALDRVGAVSSWKKTKTGRRSTAKDSIEEGIEDPKLLALLLYRGAVATCVRTFMGPWLRMADVTGGWIFTQWNQVRQSHDEGGLFGARTGRLSSSPNLQNIPTISSPNYERVIKYLKLAKLLDRFAPFPMVREYLAPDAADHYLLDRDYSQQELRILGHYEGAVLMQKYNEDPWLDVHETARQLINGMLGTSFTRRPIKDTGFGLIYGMGLDKLALKIESDKKVARTIKDAYLAIFPGLGELDAALKWRGRLNEPIRTWGGREYYVEPPKYSEKYGRMQTFDYKLLNVLIQGSAGDNTKQAMINYDRHPKRRDARMLLQVHDELLASAPKKALVHEMKVLREAMEDVKFDVPMLSEGDYGTDWFHLKTFDAKGEVKYRG